MQTNKECLMSFEVAKNVVETVPQLPTPVNDNAGSQIYR